MHFCLSLTCNIPRTLELAFYLVATKEVFPFLKLSLLLPFSPYFLLFYFHFHVNLSPHFHPDHSPSVGSLHLPTFNLESNFAPRLIAQILELLRNRETGANPPHPSNKTFKIVAKKTNTGERGKDYSHLSAVEEAKSKIDSFKMLRFWQYIFL